MVPTPSRSARAHAVTLMLAGVLLGCGGGEAEGAGEGVRLPPRPGATLQSPAEAARASVDALLATPSPATLLTALGQSHGVARALLGRHTLAYTAEFSLVPAEPEARPAVDAPVLAEQKVVDTLELKWAASPGEPVRFHLSQYTDQHRGREVMVVGEQAYTRMLHRGWHARPVDADIHLRWLDEAQRSVHDVVELAAPALAVAAVEEGEVVRVTLGLADPADPGAHAPVAASAAPNQAWRERATITAIEGTLTLGRATGLWQSAELRVGYSLRDALERRLDGETHLTGAATAAPELEVEAPEHVQPLPERVRYEAERRRMLDGLAGT